MAATRDPGVVENSLSFRGYDPTGDTSRVLRNTNGQGAAERAGDDVVEPIAISPCTTVESPGFAAGEEDIFEFTLAADDSVLIGEVPASGDDFCYFSTVLTVLDYCYFTTGAGS